MKSLFYVLFLLLSTPLAAQEFEGVIQWSIETEIKDPVMKAQMEEAKKSMQDPQKIKEMQEQMNDPQFKAMMEQNPQMKAQLEKAMKMMQQGGMESMVPKGMTIKIKNGNMLYQMEGGFMDDEFLFLKDQEKTFMVDRENKTYSVAGTKDPQGTTELDVKVTKTNEKGKVLNYMCTKYLVEANLSGKPIQQEVWATTEIKGIDFESLASQKFNNSDQTLFYKDIDGVPLKMVMNSAEATMVMQVTALDRKSVPSSAFVIPSDFKETKATFGPGK